MDSFDLFYKEGDNIEIIRMRDKDSGCLGINKNYDVGRFMKETYIPDAFDIPIPADVESVVINGKEFKRQFFKPGDIVVGNTEHRYGVTTLGFIGKVVQSFGDYGRNFTSEDILIKDLVDGTGNWKVCSMFFRHATPEEIEKISKHREHIEPEPIPF